MNRVKNFTMLPAIMLLAMQVSVSEANPYDHCEQAFVGGKFNTELSVISEDKSMSMKLWLCSQEERISSNSDSFDFAARFAGIFGSGDYSKSRFQNWKTSSCSNLDVANNSSKRAYFYRQTADSRTIEAWEKCISKANNSLVCWAEPVDKELFILRLKVPQSRANGYKDLRLTTTNAELQGAAPKKIGEGETREFVAKRSGGTSDSSIVLVSGKAISDSYNAGCSVIIPPVPEAPKLDEEKTMINIGPSTTWLYKIQFTVPIVAKSGKIIIGSQTFDITNDLIAGVSNQFTGSFGFSLENEHMTESERQAWYWEAHHKLKCDNLSCNNGYIERKWSTEVLPPRKKRNRQKQEAHTKGVSATITVTDTRDRVYNTIIKIN